MREETKEKISIQNSRTYWTTDEKILRERHRKISEKKRGQSVSGLVDWNIVEKIRNMHKNNYSKKEIHKNFSKLSRSTINDIISHRTWKS